MTRRHQTTPAVPLGPTHRRAWRSLWRRCSCGLATPASTADFPPPSRPSPHATWAIGDQHLRDQAERHAGHSCASSPAAPVTTPEPATEHTHNRPQWDCRVCGRPWPCANAKSDLSAEFRDFPSVLAVYMSGQMHDALLDLTSHGTPAPPDLYERFLGWVERSRPGS